MKKTLLIAALLFAAFFAKSQTIMTDYFDYQKFFSYVKDHATKTRKQGNMTIYSMQKDGLSAMISDDKKDSKIALAEKTNDSTYHGYMFLPNGDVYVGLNNNEPRLIIKLDSIVYCHNFVMTQIVYKNKGKG